MIHTPAQVRSIAAEVFGVDAWIRDLRHVHALTLLRLVVVDVSRHHCRASYPDMVRAWAIPNHSTLVTMVNRSERMRATLDYWRYRSALEKRLNCMVCCSRFAYLVKCHLSSGLDLERAVSLTRYRIESDSECGGVCCGMVALDFKIGENVFAEQGTL